MRRGVDYIGVGVGAAIISPDGKLFLAQRGKQAKNERGKWEVPGGGVEFGETMEETIVREMMEEFGIEIEVIDKLGFYNHILPKEKQHWLATSFVCRIKRGVPKIIEPEKTTKIGWFTLEAAEKLPASILLKGDIEALKKKYPHGMPNFYI